MIIASLTLENFRCFGPEAETLELNELTAVLGANGSGKSAVLMALVRMFGLSSGERAIERGDFHLPVGADPDSLGSAELVLEAELRFPELQDADGDDGVGPAACFKHMTIEEEGAAPYCRVRLEASWEPSSLFEGEIDQRLLWVCAPYGANPDEEAKAIHAMSAQERSRIHVHYVPASRDPSRQIRVVSGSLLHRLLRAVEWSDDVREQIAEASGAVREAFAGEAGVEVIETALRASWGELHAASEHRRVAIRPVAKELADVIRQVEATFSPGPSKREDDLDRLSDGQRSLFYLSIVSSLFDVQSKVASGEAREGALNPDELVAPALNVLAIEEPENHVAPHYLGRIMELLRTVAEGSAGQVVATSHSPSIVSRVEPEEIRHLRKVGPENTAIIRSITLPDSPSDVHAFVREAVKAYPELYFARLVVLGEGASEEIVLPRIADVLGVCVDASFVSVVPLGGRHVAHFWRLLKQLDIPHITLLDLDRERPGGGWGRVKYAIQQLLAVGVDRSELLTVDGPDDTKHVMDEEEFGALHTRDDASEEIDIWVEELEDHGVYFSAPLDLDFLLQRAFPAAYERPGEDGVGPRIPSESDKYGKAVPRVIRSVLKGKASSTKVYNDGEVRAFFWYRYLFQGRSKPSTHIEALSRMKSPAIKKGVPPVLKRVMEAVAGELVRDERSEDDA